MNRYSLRRGATCIALLLVFVAAASAQEVARIPIIDAPDSTPGLGAGFRYGNDNYIGETSRTDLIPLYLYEGDRFYAHGTELGLHFVDNETFVFNTFARVRFNRLDPTNNVDLAGMSKRHQSVDAGFSASLHTWLGQFELAGAHDVLGVSNGGEAIFTYRYPVKRYNWSFSPYFSVSYLDAKLTNYYYGVRLSEATPERPAYTPGEAVNASYGVDTAYHFSDKLFVFGNIGFEGLDSAIANSPIVRANNSATAFVGAAYLFGDQKKFPKADIPVYESKLPRWSYRVHYGYQLFHNIFPLPMVGYWPKSERTPGVTPKQVGLTLSRLIQPGDRVDFYARLGLYNHDEKPFQDNFWSYNVYMSAMVKSYSKWSGDIAFRWGLSFGVSYADKLPAEEVHKFDKRGKNSSRLLNYLEWQVDFPLSRLVKADFARNCFIGLVVTHRSGIFGTSDLLGNVAGGSDWGGLHLECMR